ncbi:uncharacterized protein VTP21DRAFT_11476 [Calcarisporiella thermophila]|uniref:uncharacterized protein n=1 Tax=Calcarisporiella thermophila TaxID=911321 RepID=UPI0037432735
MLMARLKLACHAFRCLSCGRTYRHQVTVRRNFFTSSAKAVQPQLATTSIARPEPIQLPNSGITTRIVAPTQLGEQLAVLHASIRTGEMDRARRIFKNLHKTTPDAARAFVDIHVHNAFMDGYVEAKPSPRTREALAWFDELSMYGLKPDITSFAILIKGFLRTKSYNTTRVLIQEMEKSGFTIEQLMRNPHLGDEELIKLREAIKESSPADLEHSTNILRELDLAKESASKAKESAENIPEVKPTSSAGLLFLRKTLGALEEKHLDRYERQLKLEERAYEVALDRLNHEKQASISRGDKLGALNLSPLKRRMWEWHTGLKQRIEKELKQMEENNDNLAVFLKLLKPEKLSVITILEMLNQYNTGITGGMRSTRALITLGKAIENEYHSEQMKKKSNSHLFSKKFNVHSLYSSGKLFNMSVRRAQSKLVSEDLQSDWKPIWPQTTRAKVGSVLASLLIDTAKIPVTKTLANGEKIVEELPAFYHTYAFIKGKKVGVIMLNDNLCEMLAREPLRDTLHPKLLPMLVHPKPWLTYNSGGYLATKSVCMRTKDSPEQMIYLRKASEQDRLSAVLTGLDVLGSTRWTINRGVFNVVLEAWNTGEAIADIPPAKLNLPYPTKPTGTDQKEKHQWAKAMQAIELEKRNNHSLRCTVNYRIEIARAFLNEPIYFPHNLDFRGRAYPMPPLLNHLGDDLCRGLLKFDEAKPLGSKGLKWLKIHLANVVGYDKYSFVDREQFTMNNLENIFDSADRPLTGKRWWLQAENPWQCLASCLELTEALRSPVPEEYRSRLPIHQDGTCNGLQHYAALGGDIAGAQAVNLEPSDRPQDVYAGVLNLVIKQVDREAAEGNEHALMLQGKLTRKVIKQTVMTNVYGVTFVGAREQIAARLKEINVPEEEVYKLSVYLARKVFDSIGELFSGARKIQDWLNLCAHRIAKSVPPETLERVERNSLEVSSTSGKGKKKAQTAGAHQMTSVIWTTPLGLPIVQPYRKVGQKAVKTNLQMITIEDPNAPAPVNTRKQRTAFPPNFIHSLDATHMLMSAVTCQAKGLTFAAVHDSYWTHASDVDTMNTVIRDEFVKLHSQPLMERLRDEFVERYGGYKMPVPVSSPEGKRLAKLTRKVRAKVEELPPPVVEPWVEEMLRKTESEIAAETKTEKEGKYADEVDMDEVLLGEEEEEEENDDNLNKSEPTKLLQQVWVDLEIPPLPPKGEFDVSKVKLSDYFFH